MQPNTRKLFNRLCQNIAEANGVDTVLNESVTYTPERQQMLFGMLGDNADFLQQINHVHVSAQVGERIGLGVNRPIAGRTNTDEEERKTRYVGDLNGDSYHCVQTDFDTHISYKLLDSWGFLGEFGDTYSSQVVQQIARDVLMIGFNGLTAAPETDFDTNKLLQDVNIGWLEKVRLNEPKRVMGYDSDGEETEDTWNLGEGGHYDTLDGLVFDMTTNLLDDWHQEAEDLVVLVGREIWVNHGLGLLSNSTMPTERNALQSWFSAQSVAGMPCVKPPFFPKRGVVVTSYKNLSIYHELETLRRVLIDNPKRNRVEEFISENQAYVVEDYGKYAGVRDGAIKLRNTNGDWV